MVSSRRGQPSRYGHEAHPYRIEESGRQAFDQWLIAPSMDDGDLGIWLMFADRASAETRARVLDRREEELWMRSKTLARLRDDALARPNRVDARYDPLPSLLFRQMKQVAAELEFLREFRVDFEAWLRTFERASSRGVSGRQGSIAPETQEEWAEAMSEPFVELLNVTKSYGSGTLATRARAS